MPTPLDPLKDGDVVVIIGGGPAGSSCAIKLKKLAIQKGIHPRIILYENKRFEKKSYYNQCLGVLSPPLDKILEQDLEVPFPWQIVRRKINGYSIHSDNEILELSGEHDPSYACRRVEFDNYLFQKAKDMEIETIPARVTDLDFSSDDVMVFSESNNIKADVVIGAFGLDDGMAKVFERISPYRQSKFLSSIVTKIHPGDEAMEQFGNSIHAFLPSSLSSVEFGAITPKGNHLSINIAGKKVTAGLMDRFLDLPIVKQVLPENLEKILPHLYYFKGKFPTLPANGTFGDRYVMVGDAAGFNRPFKGKGINSAIFTGIRAAETIVDHGYSKQAFQKYLESCCQLTDDVPYGTALRFLVLQCFRFRLIDAAIATAKEEPMLKKAFFNIVSGQETYKKTWRDIKGPVFLFRIGFKILINKITKRR